MLGIAAAGKIRVFRHAREHAMGANMNVVVTIFLGEDFSISRHEHRDGIREKQQSRGHCASHAIGTRVSNAGILQIDGIHEVVQCDVCVATAQTRKQRSEEPEEGIQRITAECAEEQIEPNDIWF